MQIYSVTMNKSSRFESIRLYGHKLMAGNFNVCNGKWLDATIIRVELLLYRNQKWLTKMLQKMKLKIRMEPQHILFLERKKTAEFKHLQWEKRLVSYLIIGTWPFCMYFNPEILETPKYSLIVPNRHFLRIDVRGICFPSLIFVNCFRLHVAIN